MPFRFGVAVMTELVVIYLRVEIETGDGGVAAGVGASVLSPMWFEKDPSRSIEARRQNLLMSVGMAVSLYQDAGADTAYALHRAVQPEARQRCGAFGIPALPASFGVALMDSAIVDALCLLQRTSFHAGLESDLFGFGAVPWLPRRPASELFIRHTVGLGDPLVAGDIDVRLNDGLPETLEEVIHEYGCSYFKIKISNDVEASVDRLCRIEAVLREAGVDYATVLDGNEQFADMSAFVPFVEALEGEPLLREFRRRLLWFEQPLEREAALSDSVVRELRLVSEERPVILDESDGTDEVVGRALELGYGGVSAKNCKGVFRTLHSRRVLADKGGVLAAEDLTNPPLLPLHQDTAVAAALGLVHAERNGHHYVRGLDFLSQREQETALERFPSLYERMEDGLVRLKIRNGAVLTGEVHDQGYGMRWAVDLGACEPLSLPSPGEGP